MPGLRLWRRKRDLAGILDGVAAEARWEAIDLTARRGGSLAADLLRGRTAELEASPDARDQLLAVALERAARQLIEGAPVSIDLSEFRSPKKLPPDLLEEIRNRAQRACDAAAQPGRAREYAWLEARFWSDPRIPASLDVRARMFSAAQEPRGLSVLRLFSGPGAGPR